MEAFFSKTEIEGFLHNNMSIYHGTIMLNVSGSLSDGTLFQEEAPLNLARALIGINHVAPAKTVVGSGYNMTMNLAVQSQGLPATGPVTVYATAENADNELVGYWGFDEGAGTTAHDNSGFGNHGDFSFEKAWEWQTIGDLEGWAAISDIANLQCDGTSMKGITTGGSPNVDSPGSLVIDASVVKTVHLRMNVTNASYPARMYFITAADPLWSSDKSMFFALRDAGQWSEYSVDMSSAPGWSGTITQIKLVPSCAPGGVAFSFDWIRIGGNPRWTGGKYDTALDFDGLDDLIEAPFISLDDRSFTVTAWFNARSLPSFPVDAGILRQCDTPSADKYLHIAIRNSRVYFGFYGDDLTSDSTVTTNTWYHIACVYNYSSNRKSIYINGILDQEGPSLSTYKGTSGLTEIGYSGCFFNGTLDEVRIYNQALTGEAIEAAANSGAIQTRQVTLGSWESANVTFTWRTAGWSKGNYKISVCAWPIQGETFVLNNTFTDGTIYVGTQGDVDGNHIVNMLDLYKIALRFGATRYQPYYVPEYDIEDNGIINMLDLYITAIHFGITDP
jgi:hypothetical protein